MRQMMIDAGARGAQRTEAQSGLDNVAGARLVALAVPVVLYGLAVTARVWAAGLISFPLTEGSAYYVNVARNLVAGRGLEIDALWSYATPPLTLPRPAFELWQPLASLIAAVPMSVLGPTFDAAQLGFALVGALLSPLAWLVARDAARRLRLPPRREATVAIGAGVLVAVSGPLALPAAVPDSTLPFTIFGVAACLVMPAAAAADRRAVIGLGVLLGLAYLTRLEAVWLGLTFAVLVTARMGSVRRAVPLVGAVAVVAAICALPWWVRNAAVFGTPLPGQVTDNIFLTRNEQIFGYLDRPSLDGFVGQGVATLAGNAATAAWHNTVDVLLVPAGAVVLAGLFTIAVAVVRRRPAANRLAPSPLAALLVSGAITFAATTLLFPIATLWGTFEHAAGPVLVGLIVAGLLGADWFVAALVRWRSWPRSNAWLAPLTLIVLTLPLTVLQVTGAARQAAAEQRAISHVAAALPPALDHLGVGVDRPLISDRPIWLAAALGRPVIALPDEPSDAVLRLAADFGAEAVVIVEGRGRHPAALRDPAFGDCFAELSLGSGDAPAATLFGIEARCAR
jgi:hypothetical protein